MAHFENDMKLLVHGTSGIVEYTISNEAACDHAMIAELQEPGEELTEVPVVGLAAVQHQFPRYLELAETIARLEVPIRIACPLLTVAAPQEAVDQRLPRPLEEQGVPEGIVKFLEKCSFGDLLDFLLIADELHGTMVRDVVEAQVAWLVRGQLSDVEFRALTLESQDLYELEGGRRLVRNPDGITYELFLEQLALRIRLKPQEFQEIDDWNLAEAILTINNRYTAANAPLFLQLSELPSLEEVQQKARELAYKIRQRDSAVVIDDAIVAAAAVAPDHASILGVSSSEIAAQWAEPSPAAAAASASSEPSPSAAESAAAAAAEPLDTRKVWIMVPLPFSTVIREDSGPFMREVCAKLDSGKSFIRLVLSCKRYI